MHIGEMPVKNLPIIGKMNQQVQTGGINAIYL